MSTKKQIGRIPISKGQYVAGQTYNRLSQVTLYGSTYQSMVDGNTSAPAILDENGNIQHANTDQWLVIADGREAYNAGERTSCFSKEENPEYLAVETDADGKVLAYTGEDGSHYAHNMKSETIEAKQDKEKGKGLIDEGVAEAHTSFEDPEGRMNIETDANGKILSYRDKEGIKHEHVLEAEKIINNGEVVEFTELAKKEYVDNKGINELTGVIDYNHQNLFDSKNTRSYDSEFADKVFKAIGRKTASTGCYSNNIECNIGDWFTRSDFGTGIVVVLDENENILGDIKGAAYHPTIQIKESDGQDFSKARYVVFVVMNENVNEEKIVKAKYITSTYGDYITIPKLKVFQDNVDSGLKVYLEGTSKALYELGIDDTNGDPSIVINKVDGILPSSLPLDFPKFTVTGDFSKYYKSLVMCPIEGDATEYLFELGTNGLVTRYIKHKVNCPRILREKDTMYYYGVDGALNYSTGKLSIFKANEKSFSVVQTNIGDSNGDRIEPHDCLLISVSPLHYICQKYITNKTTVVNGVNRLVTALHVEEVYDGNSVWEWHSEDYPELWIDSHARSEGEDYLHNNTICLDADGNLCLNNKHANQILVIERKWNDDNKTGSIGNILWKIGGNHSHAGYDVNTRIKTTDEQQWFECHDAVVNDDGLWTLFDNEGSQPSRIVEFKIDKTNKVLTDFKSYTHDEYRGRFMGSADKVAEGVYLVSWGSSRSGNAANVGLYDFKAKKTLFELRLNNMGSSTYRVYGIKNNN